VLSHFFSIYPFFFFAVFKFSYPTNNASHNDLLSEPISKSTLVFGTDLKYHLVIYQKGER